MATVLIVDDRPVNREYLVSLLTYGGHRMLEAADGQAALDICRTDRPDLVITDLRMPNMDGLEFTRQLRLEPGGAALPVIFYTATFLQGEARAMAETCGVTLVLMKPCGPQEILAAVSTCLGVPAFQPPAEVASRLQSGTHEALIDQPLALKLADLVDLTEAMARAPDPLVLLERFCQGARYIMGSRFAGALIRGREYPVVCWGANHTRAVAVRPREPGNLLGRVMSERRTVRLHDLSEPLSILGLGLEGPIGSFAGAPIQVADEVFGVLFFAGKVSRPEFDQQDESMAGTLATQLAVAYHNATLLSKVQAAETKYRLLVEQMPAITFVSDTANPWQMVYVSPQIEDLLGFPCSDWTDSAARWRAQIHPEDLARLEPAFARSVLPGARIREEYRLSTRDGRLVWVLHSALATADADGACLFKGYLIDVTDRRLAEEGLREADQSYRFLADAVPHILFRTRPDGALEYCNQCWFDYTGRSRDAARGEAWESLVHPDDLARFTDRWRAAIQSGTAFSEECRLRRAVDGTYRWHAGRAVPRRDENGKVRHWVGACTDIDDSKRALEMIHALNAELEQRVADRTRSLEQVNASLEKRTLEVEAANQELEAFSYSVSHDLRAPLRAIDGYSRMLLKDHASVLPPEGLEHLHDVRRNAQKMGQLVDDLLGFARLSREPMNGRQVALAPLIQTCVRELCPRGETQRAEFRVGALSDCWADPAMLKQVWVNLLSNAVKYSGKRDSPVIEVGSHIDPASGAAVYFVKDNGVGFNMRYASKLFGVFQRLHRAEDFEGTGVGLAIVQRVVHRHGGRVWAESVPDKGATFSFTLGSGPPP